MPRRRLLIATMAAAALPLTATLPATAAQASTGSIVIDSVSSPQSSVGTLTIQAEATSPITSLTAHVYSGNTDVLDVSSFTLSAGGATDGIWTVNSPVTQGQLPLGSYQVKVDAADSGGDSVTGVPGGTLNFLIVPTITAQASSTVLTVARQSVTISGRVTGLYPDGTVKPLTGQSVAINGGVTSVYAATDVSGDYSAVLLPSYNSTLPSSVQVWANVQPNQTVYWAASPNLTVTGELSPVEITSAVSAPIANYGQPVTFSGAVRYESGGTWLPLEGQVIDVTGNDLTDPGMIVPAVHATTDSNGNFSVPLPAQPSTTWTANLAQNPYADLGSYPYEGLNSATVLVRLPTAVTALRAAFTPLGQITVSGNLALTSQLSSLGYIFQPIAQHLELQYSAGPAGPWRDIGAPSQPLFGQTCPAGSNFCGGFNSTVVSGYYRVTYAGQLTYLPSVSAVVHASTIRTKIINFGVSPGAVTGHGRITVSGKLEELAPSWRGFGGRQILILIEPKGSNTWYWYKKVRTTSTGRFSSSFADPITGRWAAGYAGDSGHLLCVSRVSYVLAAGTASARLRPAGLAGHAITMRPAWFGPAPGQQAAVSVPAWFSLGRRIAG